MEIDGEVNDQDLLFVVQGSVEFTMRENFLHRLRNGSQESLSLLTESLSSKSEKNEQPLSGSHRTH